MKKGITVVGGGLAGCEAAWQAARQGVGVRLIEMRPAATTEAHKTALLAELVCSNSLRSKDLTNGAGLLKEELRLADSLIMTAALQAEVPAGSALAVDRGYFSSHVTEALEAHPLIEIVREEVSAVPGHSITIIATGPLTSRPLAGALSSLIGEGHLYFYDAIAPILEADSIDNGKVYRSSRYDKGGDDYVNCPMSKEEYDLFYDELLKADTVVMREFEDAKVFEGCMPVEVMARRGRDTLRYGPLRPVGLKDPGTGKTPHAVVQLRTENLEKTAYNMVGFQTRLRWPEQQRVFRMIPGLEHAEFLRFGSIHRNTYINAPRHLNSDLSLKENDALYLAGQLTGVEGYIESTAMGLIAGINAARRLLGKETVVPPRETAHGSLVHFLIASDPLHFQPSNINFGLLPVSEVALQVRDKKTKRQMMADAALRGWTEYVAQVLR